MKTLLAIALLLTTSVCVGQTKKDSLLNSFKLGIGTVKYTPPDKWYWRTIVINKQDGVWRVIFMPHDTIYVNDMSYLEASFLFYFVKYWDIYTKECYADSTELGTEQYRPMYMSEIEDSIKHGSPIWKEPKREWKAVIKLKSKKIWIYPIKPTLEGFVEFLRRKMK